MNIKGQRKKVGLSQAELAERIGTSQQNIQRWENGKIKPSDKMMKKMEEELMAFKSQPLQDLPLMQLSTPHVLEEFVARTMKYKLKNELEEMNHIYGGQGEKQYGIDVLHYMQNGKSTIIQCKQININGSFGPKKIHEVNKTYLQGGRNDDKKILALTKYLSAKEIEAAREIGWEIVGLREMSGWVRDLNEVDQRKIVKEFFSSNSRQILKNCLGIASDDFLEKIEDYKERVSGSFFNYNNKYVKPSGLYDEIKQDINNKKKQKIFLISGRSGSGKKRLIFELSKELSLDAFLIKESSVIIKDELIQTIEKGGNIIFEYSEDRQNQLLDVLDCFYCKRNENSSALFVLSSKYDKTTIRSIILENGFDSEKIGEYDIDCLDVEESIEFLETVVEKKENENLLTIGKLAGGNQFILSIGAEVLDRSNDDKAINNDDLNYEIKKKFKTILENVLKNKKEIELAEEILKLMSIMQPIEEEKILDLFLKVTHSEDAMKVRKIIESLSEGEIIRDNIEQRFHITSDLLANYYRDTFFIAKSDVVNREIIKEIASTIQLVDLPNMIANIGKLKYEKEEKIHVDVNYVWNIINDKFSELDFFRKMKLIDRIEESIYYDPDNAMMFVKKILSKEHNPRILSKIIGLFEYLSLEPAYTESCLELVVSGANKMSNKEKEKNIFLETLRRMARIEAYKPVAYINKIVDYLFNYYAYDNSNNFSLLAALDGVMITKGTSSMPRTNISFVVYPFCVDLNKFKEIRKRIVDYALAAIKKENQKELLGSLQLIREILQSNEISAVIIDEKIYIEKEIKTIIDSGETTVLIRALLINLIKTNDARYSEGKIVGDLDLEIAVAISTNESLIRFSKEETWDKWKESAGKEASRLSKALLEKYKNKEFVIIDKIEETINGINTIFDNFYFSTLNILMYEICKESSKFCRELIEKINDNGGPLDEYCGIALRELDFTHRKRKYTHDVVEDAISQGDDRIVCLLVDYVFCVHGMSCDLEWSRNIIKKILKYPSEKVRKAAIARMTIQAHESEAECLDMISGMLLDEKELDICESIIAVIYFLKDERTIEKIDGKVLKVVNKSLVEKNKLSYYDVEYLQKLSKADPAETTRIMLRRIEKWYYDMKEDFASEYEQIPYNCKIKTIDNVIVLDEIINWIRRDNMNGGKHILYYESKIIKLFCIPDLLLVDGIIDILKKGKDEWYLVAMLASALSKEFIWNIEGTERLYRYMRFNKEKRSFNDILFGNFIENEFISREIGKPDKRKEELLNKAIKYIDIASSQYSPATELYREIKRYIQGEMERDEITDNYLTKF